ncbi:MAG: hypothetical protein ACK4IX_18185, partial [Candidatus Sericytochromatia bacterium]
KTQLEITYIEKEHQVRAQKELLQTEFKNAEDERRQLSLELSDRRVQIDKLKNKFEILLQRLKPEDDGEQVSQAQFLIRAIQEREELQRRGDMIDSDIQKLEQDEKALDLTLSAFQRHNSLTMGTFKRVGTDDRDVQDKAELSQKVKELDTMLSRRIQEQSK